MIRSIFWYGRQMQFRLKALYELPVGGGTGVDDVLFGREQRQAVGIKVDRLRAHDGKSFRTTPAASLFTGPDGFRGRTICWETATAEHWGSFTAEETAVKLCRFMQCGLKFQSGAICAGAAHSQRGGDCDCTLLFVQRGRRSFHYKAPPPVERVESIMTSLAAGSLVRKRNRSQLHVQIINASCILIILIFSSKPLRELFCFVIVLQCD